VTENFEGHIRFPSENPIGELISEVEHFEPKPGGMIDRFHQESARRHEAERQRENIHERVEEASFKSVKVTQLMPEVFSATTFNIAAGGNALILPLSKYRYRASVMLVTPDPYVVLCKDQGAAIAGNGFTLPSGIIYPIMTRAQIWCFNPAGNGVIQLSVGAELYAPEQ